jgi:hypothetical protein
MNLPHAPFITYFNGQGKCIGEPEVDKGSKNVERQGEKLTTKVLHSVIALGERFGSYYPILLPKNEKNGFVPEKNKKKDAQPLFLPIFLTMDGSTVISDEIFVKRDASFLHNNVVLQLKKVFLFAV